MKVINQKQKIVKESFQKINQIITSLHSIILRNFTEPVTEIVIDKNGTENVLSEELISEDQTFNFLQLENWCFIEDNLENLDVDFHGEDLSCYTN